MRMACQLTADAHQFGLGKVNVPHVVVGYVILYQIRHNQILEVAVTLDLEGVAQRLINIVVHVVHCCLCCLKSRVRMPKSV